MAKRPHTWKAAALMLLVVTPIANRPAQAQSWPSHPIKVIMATAAGSAPDVNARIVTDRLAQLWGQQVLILNRPGAGGLIALQALATAARDNHTLYLPSSSSLVVLPETNSKLPLDFERDLVPIGIIGETPFMIVAGNTLGVRTLAEAIVLAKSKPGELTYAGNFRSLPNMTGEMFASHAGIKLTFVPYPGSPPALQDVLGGRISLMVEGIAAFTGALQAKTVLRSPSLRRAGCRTIRICRRPLRRCLVISPAAGPGCWHRPDCLTTSSERSTRTCARC